ncbi:MAG TPA: tetratricopeptide repeat protein [Blastocatellia bacterium]|nr:tetratricopeptide repeat protein [Blastocatellia bacterium]
MLSNWSQTQRTAEKHLSRGKLTAAIEEYHKLVTWDPTDLAALNTLGDLYARAGRDEDATRTFSTVARGYQHEGFTSKTIAVLKKILRIDPTNLDAAARLAECYAAQGQRGEAVRQYVVVAEAYEQAERGRKSLEAYQRAAEIDPANTSLLITLGERLLRDGLNQRAHRSFVAAADELTRLGEREHALAVYLKAREIYPDDLGTLKAIASICAARGEAANAVPLICESLERNPESAELQRLLGSTYLAAGRLDDAHRTFVDLMRLDDGAYRDVLAVSERILEIGDPDRAAEHIDGLIDVMLARREEQDAVDFLRKILARDPMHAGSLRRLAWIFRYLREDFNLIPTLRSLAESAIKRGDRAEAIEALNELCDLEPYEKSYREDLRMLGVDASTASYEVSPAPKGRFELVTAEARSSLLVPKSAMPGKAWTSVYDGQPDEAIAELRRILIDDPDNLDARVALKELYARLGMTDMAANECLQIGRINYSNRGPAAYDFIDSNEFQESLKLSQRTASSVIGSFAGFELFTRDNRRRADRSSLRLPLVVTSRDGGWCEFTETVDVSDFGMRLSLSHLVTPKTTLSLALEMAKWPNGFAQPANGRLGVVVRHSRRTPNGLNLVGVEL